MKDKFSARGTPYDIWTPPEGHEERFRIRLEKRRAGGGKIRFLRPDWSKWFVAASILFLGFAWWWTQPEWRVPLERQTAGIIRRVEQNRQHLEDILQKELEAAGWEGENPEDLPGAQELIDDAYLHLERLEKDYRRLEKEFRTNGHYRILDAMIRNKEMQHRVLTDLKRQLWELRNRRIYEKQTHQS